MKKLVLFAAIAMSVYSANAQSKGLCTGMKENAQAGKTVESMTGGFNPDKMDRVKTDGIRESICNSKEKSERERPERPERNTPEPRSIDRPEPRERRDHSRF